MMKKTGAGILWFGIGVFVLGGGWMGVGGAAFAQGPAEIPPVAAAAEPPATPAPEETPAIPAAAEYEYTYQKKLADLNEADVAELRQQLAEVEAQIDDADIATANAQIQTARDQAAANSPEVKALRAQIARLQDEIRLAIDRDATVMTASAGANRTHMEFMDRLNFRTGLLRLIAEKERQSKWTEPTPVPEEKTP